MRSAVEQSKRKTTGTPPGGLPPRMRVLLITGFRRTGGWLAEAFANDSLSEVLLQESVGMAAGLARLRDEVFDAVLVSHEPGELDALDLLDALRTGSSGEQPIIVLGDQSEQQMAALCFEVGADAYVCVNTTTTRTLIWQIARAMERHRLVAENRRLLQEQRHRLQQEHEEANRLLGQQRALIADLQKLRSRDETGGREKPAAPRDRVKDASQHLPLPEKLVSHYRELLRAYVVMGTGSLTDEMNQLASLLATAHVTARQAMQLHLHVLEEMVEGLGSRSARHVMNRADLLVLEVIINLAEGYRQRYRDQLNPPSQLTLPGFERPCGLKTEVQRLKTEDRRPKTED